MPENPESPSDEPLSRNRDFSTLLVSQSVSAGGDAVSATALPLLVLALTGSGLAMGVVMAVNTGADFVMAPFAGAMADRGDRKRMMFVADVGRALFTALIPLSDLVHGPTMVVILLVSAPLAILRGFFRAGYLASMPNLEGLVYVARHPVLRTVILLFALASAALVSIGAAMTFRIVRDLGESPAAFGLTLTGFGVGTLGGSLFATRLGHATNVARVLVLALLLMGGSTIAIAAINSLPVIVALSALSGAGEAALVVVYVSVRAANSPDELVGRIASTARVMALGLMPIGSLIGGILIDAVGGTGTLAILGASTCVLALGFSQVRPLRAASFAPPHVRTPEPLLPISHGLER